jgi:pimeloyl-ACP methyl ester carboxylesterase
VQSVELNGTPYAIVDEGSGPPVLFGHGLLASREMFRGQIDALKDRYRCVSVDWPGHGDSGYRAGGFDFYDMLDDTLALLDHLGAERAVLAGLSQGGMVFMRLALAHPERVAGLVLLDTSAGPEDPAHLPSYEEMATALRDGDDEVRRPVAQAAQQILYGSSWLAENPAEAEHELGLILSHDRQGMYLAARAVFDRDDVLGRVSEITAPTLVICGADDSATPLPHSEALHAAIRGSELVVIPDAGHHSALERPQPVAAAIERFLARIGY